MRAQKTRPPNTPKQQLLCILKQLFTNIDENKLNDMLDNLPTDIKNFRGEHILYVFFQTAYLNRLETNRRMLSYMNDIHFRFLVMAKNAMIKFELEYQPKPNKRPLERMFLGLLAFGTVYNHVCNHRQNTKNINYAKNAVGTIIYSGLENLFSQILGRSSCDTIDDYSFEDLFNLCMAGFDENIKNDFLQSLANIILSPKQRFQKSIVDNSDNLNDISISKLSQVLEQRYRDTKPINNNEKLQEKDFDDSRTFYNILYNNSRQTQFFGRNGFHHSFPISHTLNLVYKTIKENPNPAEYDKKEFDEYLEKQAYLNPKRQRKVLKELVEIGYFNLHQDKKHLDPKDFVIQHKHCQFWCRKRRLAYLFK